MIRLNAGEAQEDDLEEMTNPEAKKTSPGGKGKKMNEVLIIVLFLVGWYVLNAFVLPRFGIST